jgi:hypothetical protein
MQMNRGKWFPGTVVAWVCLWVLGVGSVARGEGVLSETCLHTALSEACAGAVPDMGSCSVLGPIERRRMAEDVHEYSFRVRVGSGAHDVITLHRVVREVAPWRPARTAKSVFLVHGDVWGFRGAFLGGGEGEAARHSFAFYLARQGVDVWGIDLRWVHVPVETRDFSFMRSWNLGLHARDVGTGLLLARVVRALSIPTPGRLEKMTLLGWSRGATVAYAWLNAEARLPPELRHVGGFIPVDMAFTLAPEDKPLRQAACLRYEDFSQRLAAGQYEGGAQGLGIQYLGMQALHQPEAPSTVPGLSNRQLALVAGAATWSLQSLPFTSSYHFTGGRFDASGIPTGLTWTRERLFFDFLMEASPYQSLAEQLDTEALWCGVDVPYDDHLGQVTVPVLYVGAEGGVGRHGLHGTSLLGSADVTSLLVRRYPEEGRLLDYGHADLFLAEDAKVAVWAPLLDWLERH